MADNILIDALKKAVLGAMGGPVNAVRNQMTNPIQPIDLGTIDIVKRLMPQQSQQSVGQIPSMAQPMPQPMAQPTVPPPPPIQQPISPEGKKGEKQGFNWGEFIKQIGIPLATAGVGMAVPGALAGAAGFGTGYTGQREKLREEEARAKAENEGTKDFVIVDPNELDENGNPKTQVVKVPKKAIVTKKGASRSQNMLDQFINKKTGLAEVPIVQEKKEVVVEKDGQQFKLPEEQLEDAKKQGYKLVNG